MKKTKIITTVSVLIALVCAALIFQSWNPEAFFRQKERPVTMSDIEQNITTDFTGSPAGADVPRLTSAADFTETNFEVEYMTVEPVGIIETDVSGLKPWVSHYNTRTYRGRTTTGSRRDQVSTSRFDLMGNYLPYYLLELPDHTYILAQIPQEAAKAIEKGESVTLPVAQKVGMTNTARNYLSAICAEYGVDMDGVFYAFNNEWQGKHHSTLLLIRFGAAALLWFVLAVGLTLAGWKLFKCEEP